MKTRNPIARVVQNIKMQVKEHRVAKTMECLECYGHGGGFNSERDKMYKCKACKGTGVAR